jgi:hypothetical protein
VKIPIKERDTGISLAGLQELAFVKDISDIVFLLELSSYAKL